MSRRFPLYIDLTGKPVVVYGGGAVAARRVKTLLEFGAKITVIAPEIAEEIRREAVICMEAAFDELQMPPALLVLAATDDRAVNHSIAEACRCAGVPVNNASDQTDCDFHFPAVAVRDELVVGVNAGGSDHGLVKRVAAAIRVLLEKEV